MKIPLPPSVTSSWLSPTPGPQNSLCIPAPSITTASVPRHPHVTYKDGQEDQVPGEMPPVRQAAKFRGEWGVSSTDWGSASSPPLLGHIPMGPHLSTHPPPPLRCQGNWGRQVCLTEPRKWGSLRVHSTGGRQDWGQIFQDPAQVPTSSPLHHLYLGPEQQARVR